MHYNHSRWNRTVGSIPILRYPTVPALVYNRQSYYQFDIKNHVEALTKDVVGLVASLLEPRLLEVSETL